MGTFIWNATYPDGRTVNLLLEDGIIRSIEPNDSTVPKPQGCVDATGYLLLPSLVDGHAHLDKTVYGMKWYKNEVGPRLIDRIENERTGRSAIGLDPYLQAKRYIELSLGLGVLHMRSHVDVDYINRLSLLEGVLKAREEYKDLMDIELVAFPQSGMLLHADTIGLMEEALKMGAEVVGGLDPASIDRDPKRSLDETFRLAEKYGKRVDIHLHEAAELGAFDLELIIERTKALGMQGMVAVSHAFCLGAPNPGLVNPLFEKLHDARISILTSAPPAQPAVPQVKALKAAGVPIIGGNDNMRDMWGPFGSGDMIERAQLIAMKNGFRRDDELELALSICTYAGAQLLELDGYGLEQGNTANLLLGKASCMAECIVAPPRERMVFRRGKLIAQNGVLL